MTYVYPPAGYAYPAPGLYLPLSCPNQMTVSGPPGVPMAVPPGVAAQMVPAVAFDTDTLKYYILAQIEYYFSVPNMVRDAYFRRHMDGEGWVPLSVLAGFNRIRLLTSDMSLIRDALLQSSNLEVDSAGFRVRKREGWAAWLFPENQRIPHPTMPSSAPVAAPDVGRRRSGEFAAPAAPAAPASQTPASQGHGAEVVSF
ncbi:MAG: hypothetical protein BJ554DRAFT_1843 [Olpidium bornovanus]|uniref:HTH La-type RNA-binding domain-containing protein n=1 Tax=Olpidium bornovanus TaxID=278681 RepID=A0A8H8DLV1_9FUNG|nr:MAG: hypothetical protein BJ554DRAFT_1843 [Olpidium bornovanus]